MSYKEAFNASMEYFDGDDLATKVFLDKYALRDNNNNLLEKTPEDMHHRIASEFARIEKKKFKNPLSEKEIFEYLDHFKRIIPQGSPMFGIGNPYQYISLSNCYVITAPEDSYGGILDTDQKLVQISKRRGGIGLDISKLRPANSITTNASQTSTGIIPFMERFSNSIREVGQNGRRGALMITISVHHPQILDFIKVKNDLTKVTGANISIRLTNEFLTAVKKNKEYEQRFPVDSESPTISNMVDATTIWKEIIKNAHSMAEPGLLFWDIIISESPADCYADDGFETTCTNPCSELPLCENDSCRLLLLNLFYYVENHFTSKALFNFEKYYEDCKIAQRLMDDLVDLELESIEKIIKKISSDPEDKIIKLQEKMMWQDIKTTCENGRRTGTGNTALGDTLAALNIPYSSNKGINLSEKIYKTLKLACYRSSVDIAKELGAFPVWNKNKEKNCEFLLRIKEEDEQLYKDMQKYGRRNISLLTTAPAGSVSILTQTTSGIEPVFMLSYTRRKKINPNDKNARVDFVDNLGDKWQEFEVYHPKIKMWMDVTNNTKLEESPWFGSCAEDLDWQQRIKLQSKVQKHVDHSISSTLNLPEDVTVEEVAKIYETAWESGCKGITIYRKNCRTGVLIDKSKNTAKIHKTEGVSRPREIPCDVYHISVQRKKYFVIVGLIDGDPYEVLAGPNGDTSKFNNVISGKILKVKRGFYKLLSSDNQETLIDSITDLCDAEEEAVTRLISTSLRHGVHIKYIVHQLEKTTGDLSGFARSISRALKKYIGNGEKVTGESCPECGTEDLIRDSGCISCSCGWTKCS